MNSSCQSLGKLFFLTSKITKNKPDLTATEMFILFYLNNGHIPDLALNYTLAWLRDDYQDQYFVLVA